MAPTAAEIEAFKKAARDHDASEYKPGDFVSPGAGSTGGRKKLTKEKFNRTSERYASVDDWLVSPGSGTPGSQRRSWQPKNPKLKNLSLYEM